MLNRTMGFRDKHGLEHRKIKFLEAFNEKGYF